MKKYASPEEAMADLGKKGYEVDFEFEEESFCLYCGDLDMRLNPEAFHVDEIDDVSRPGEEETVYAISGPSGIKGIIVEEKSADSQRA
ncbi:MAG: phosphoribosylpyrophosphate synthetase [Bacteroidetes bacterium]|nr:phosphoribosylpyrophosphate synthetase [Bacteroidota bacterium]